MAVGLRIGNRYWEVGGSDFLRAFFSTASYHLEPLGWGTRFPILMNELYQGKLSRELVDLAIKELADIKRELVKFPPSSIIWDIGKLEATPPWGTNISPDITNLSTYFVTSDGRDLFDVIEEAFRYLKKSKGTLYIR